MIVVNSPLGRLMGFVFSLIILAVVYFAIVKPAMDDADKQTNRALNQSQQAIDQGQKQLNDAAKQTQGANKQADKQIKSANQRLSKASQLTDCLSKAGADTSSVQKCTAKYSP